MPGWVAGTGTPGQRGVEPGMSTPVDPKPGVPAKPTRALAVDPAKAWGLGGQAPRACMVEWNRPNGVKHDFGAAKGSTQVCAKVECGFGAAGGIAHVRCALPAEAGGGTPRR